MVTVGFHTLGCKVNQQETSAITAQFVDAGFIPVDFELAADVYVINSCAVTLEAERKSKSLARRKKKQHPNSLVVLAGCFPQVALNDATNLGVDVVAGSNDKKLLAAMVQEFLINRRPLIKVTPMEADTPFEIIAESSSSERTRGMLKVQDGCEQFCAYCIIPYARGRERSLAIESAIMQARSLIDQGMSEIVLAGIHLGSYGRDLKPPTNLASLIREVARLPGLLRLRLGSLEPLDMTAELIETLKELPQVCRHFHLPLQSGSNAVLQNMKRPYTKEEFFAVVARLRHALPDVSVTSDVIVGFPGESDAQFAESLAFVENMEFGRLHVFRYSRREGTVAASMADQVPEPLKDERYRLMQQVAVLAQQRFAEKCVDREVTVLVEGEHEDLLTGYASSYLRVYFPGDGALHGKLVNVTISGSYKDGARGIIVPESCLFCRIVKKEIPAKILYEDEKVMAFADIHPVAPVHILIVPKEHVPSIDSKLALDALQASFAALGHLVAEFNLSQTGFRVVTNAGRDGGQTIPHLHWHLLGGRQFSWPPG